MKDEYTTCVALFHDIIEDTDTTREDLVNLGFLSVVIEAILLMTHSENVPYLEYVKNIKSNKIAKAVKISDLKHNSDLSRLDTITERDLIRQEKYKSALKILEEEVV